MQKNWGSKSLWTCVIRGRLSRVGGGIDDGQKFDKESHVGAIEVRLVELEQ
jgi:hypothetical protein